VQQQPVKMLFQFTNRLNECWRTFNTNSLVDRADRQHLSTNKLVHKPRCRLFGRHRIQISAGTAKASNEIIVCMARGSFDGA
jgi:hypothetical protein